MHAPVPAGLSHLHLSTSTVYICGQHKQATAHMAVFARVLQRGREFGVAQCGLDTAVFVVHVLKCVACSGYSGH